MLAAIASGVDKPLEVVDVTRGPLGPDDVVVRIEASGVCHSDLNTLEGLSVSPGWPVVLGHEACGVVEEVGDNVRSVRRGERVISTFVPTCGVCGWCLDGQTHLCRDFAAPSQVRMRTGEGTPVHALRGLGTFAEIMVASERSVVPVQTDIPAEQLALIGCAVTTGVCAALNTAAVRPGSSVAVVGAGGVGQSIIQGARIAGASSILAIDPSESKRTSALALGATKVLNPSDGDILERIRELHPDGVDYSFESAGRVDTAQTAFEVARRGAVVVVVGSAPIGAATPWSLKDLLLSGKTITSSIFGSAQVRRDFPRLVRLVESGQLDLAPMVSQTLPLAAVNEGLDAIRRGDVIRSVLTP